MSNGDDKPNWLGLLQWSLAHQDGTAPTNVDMMTQENQNWLEQVMKEGVVDEPKKLGQCILSIKQHIEGDALSGDDVDLLEQIMDITEQIDMAGVFVKLGGLTMIHTLVLGYNTISSVTEPILIAALSLAGCVCQNHPEVQESAITVPLGHATSLLDSLVQLLTSEISMSSQLQAKLLYAVSCIVRGHALGESIFISRYYLPLFSRILLQYGYMPTDADADAESITVDTDGDNVIGRVFFLSRALLSTTRTSTESVRTIGTTMLPVCGLGLTSSDVNIKDSTIGLINELLITSEGRRLLSTRLDALLAAAAIVICNLEEQLTHATSDDDKAYVSEDIKTMTTVVEKLRLVNTALDSAGSGADDAPVLLLGAPSV